MLLALIVLGPQRLPDAARQVGKAMGELRRLSSGFQAELKQALDETNPVTTVDGSTKRATTMKPAAARPPESPTDGLKPPAGRPRRTAPLKAERRNGS